MISSFQTYDRPQLRNIDDRAMPVVWKVRDHRYSTVTGVTSRCDHRAREQSCEARESQWPRALRELDSSNSSAERNKASSARGCMLTLSWNLRTALSEGGRL